MKKGIIALVFAMAMCLGLAACGSGASGGNAADFAGTYMLYEIQSENADSAASAEDIQMMSDYGLECSLVLNEDGTASLILFGEEMTGEWTADGGNALTVTIEGDAVSGTLDGDTLSLTDSSGDSLVFKQGEAAAADAGDEAAAEEGEEAAAEGETPAA